MTARNFSSEAPRYWGRGLTVVPIEPGTKKPAKELTGWNGFLAAPPNNEKQEALLKRYPDHGVGLLLGSEIVPGHLLIALDADDDQLVVPLLKWLKLNRHQRRVILSAKKGKRGATLFVLVPKGARVKSTVIKGSGDLGNIDILAGGKQTVMPGSIHPDTGLEYVDIETPLLEAPFDQLPILEADELKVLGAALGSEHIQSILAGEATHDAGVALTARLISAGATDEMVTGIFTAFLPGTYAGNSLSELPGWIESARAKGFDQKGERTRENQTAILVNLCRESGAELFNDGNETAYATVPTADGWRTVAITSSDFKHWLRHLAYRSLARPLASSTPLNEAVLTLEGEALFGGKTEPVFRRVGGDGAKVEFDLGRPDGHVVSITAVGWTVEPRSEFKMVRGAGFGGLPDPTPGGDPRQLQELLGIDELAYDLVMAFILNAMKPDGPFFMLLVEGEQGSGKSFLTQIIKRLVDPNRAEKIRLPDNDRDLMIQAKEGWFLNFDNASGMKADMSDALCSLATGGGIAVRKLYTDAELNVLSFARPFAINGISNFVNRPDLMERAIPLRLAPMPEKNRKEESVMLAEFEAMLPGLLGAIFDAVSRAMRDRNKVDAPKNLRMADAARWIKSGIAALDVDPDHVLVEVQHVQDDLFIDRVSDDPLVTRIREKTTNGPFDGYIGELFKLLDLGDSHGLPRTPSHLSRALDRLRPAMAKTGIVVDFPGRDNRGRRIRITTTGSPDAADF